MVTNIRFVESSRSQYSKAISESERGFEKARRSLVTKTKIKKGELLTEENVTTKRPSIKNSIAASWYYDIIGDDVITTKDLDVDQLIEWGDIKSLWQ
jgi:sialic acid synthase SpsE